MPFEREKVVDTLNSLPWLPEDEKEKLINELTLIEDEQIPLLIRYKDENAAEVLKRIGWPRVKDVIPQLLRWLQDMNWPGAFSIAELFVSIGPPAVPYIKEVLKGNDHTWQYWILEYVVDKWPTELIHQLQPELVKLMYIDDTGEEGVDIIAMRILATRELGDTLDKFEIIQLYEEKRKRYANATANLISIEQQVGNLKLLALPSNTQEYLKMLDELHDRYLKRNNSED